MQLPKKATRYFHNGIVHFWDDRTRASQSVHYVHSKSACHSKYKLKLSKVQEEVQITTSLSNFCPNESNF